jgi:Bacterial SH3 domain
MVIVRSMPLRKADGPLTVQLPSPAQDRPSWFGVGAVAVVGFVVGVAWPRLAGVRLGPSVPDSPAASASEGEPAAPGAPSLPVVAPVVPAALPSPAAPSPVAPSSPSPSAVAPAPPGGVRVSVAHGTISSCKSASGESLKAGDCGALPGFDGLVLPRLRKLADCPEAASTPGKVHLLVRADFVHDVLAVELGHDHGAASAAPLLACAKGALASASLDGIAHDHPRYSVAYAVTFGAPPAADPGAGAPPVAVVDGAAQVEWDVAIVRDAPKTGKVLARLQRGTPLHVGVAKDGWYPVKYGDGFSSDGWVYRGAIGR